MLVASGTRQLLTPAQRGMGKIAVILGISHLRFGTLRVIVCAQPQVLVEPVCVDHRARIHFSCRIPDAFELAHRLHNARAELPVEQLGGLLPVAVLTGHRAAVGDD